MERDRKNDHERKGARPFLSCLTIHPLSPCETGRSFAQSKQPGRLAAAVFLAGLTVLTAEKIDTVDLMDEDGPTCQSHQQPQLSTRSSTSAVYKIRIRSEHVLVKRIGCLQHRLKKPGDSPRVDAELREILDDAFEIFGLYRFHRQW